MAKIHRHRRRRRRIKVEFNAIDKNGRLKNNPFRRKFILSWCAMHTRIKNNKSLCQMHSRSVTSIQFKVYTWLVRSVGLIYFTLSYNFNQVLLFTQPAHTHRMQHLIKQNE